jgi:hydrogenase/urease accessory protein HupE
MRHPRAGRRAIVGGLLALLLAGAAPAAHAHVPGRSTVEIDSARDGLRAALVVSLAELNLLLALDADLDGKVGAMDVERASDRLARYVLARFVVEDESGALAGRVASLGIEADAEGHPLLRAHLEYPAVREVGGWRVRSEVLRDLDPRHQTFATIRSDGSRETVVLEAGRPHQAVPSTAVRRLGRFTVLGVEHIFTGYDHLVFLLGLLLAGESLSGMVRIVTSFTAAHSLTLALAGLGFVRLPSTLVEAVIALSIVYVAAENLLSRSFTRRWMVTFGFGLVHGFGFANVLEELATGGRELASLLFAFNLGVEIGQVAIAAAVLPLILKMRTHSAYPTIQRSASVGILVLGCVWLIQRTALA